MRQRKTAKNILTTLFVDALHGGAANLPLEDVGHQEVFMHILTNRSGRGNRDLFSELM